MQEYRLFHFQKYLTKMAILLYFILLLVGTATTSLPDKCAPFERLPTHSDCPKPKWSREGIIVAGGQGEGNSSIQLKSPFGIFIDHNDNLYVADFGNSRIQKFESGSTVGKTVAGGKRVGNGANQLYNPNDVFVDSNGDLFISDYGNRRVQKWSSNSKQGITMITLKGSQPQAIYVNKQGDIYVSETSVDYGGPHEIVKYSIINGSKSLLTSKIINPRGIYIDKCDTAVYVADGSYPPNGRVEKYDNTGKSTVAVANLTQPSDIILDHYGNVYVVRSSKYNVQRVSARDGKIEIIAGSKYDESGSDNERFGTPWSIDFDSQHNLYVSDIQNHRVQKFMFEGGDLSC
jgi:sugar lactone lactonase YvrE